MAPDGGTPELAVERLFDPSNAVTLFAPQSDQVDQALRANQLQPGWLAFDANKRAMAQKSTPQW